MNFRILAPIALMLAAAACDSRQQPAEPGNRTGQSAPAAANDQMAVTPPAPGTDGGLDDDRTPLPEPKGSIDPTSAEGAGQVVQQFAALVEQQRYDEAAKLWSGTEGRKSFDQAFGEASELHLQIGKPGTPEGAAGSIYVEVPVVIYGKRDGKPFSRARTAVLRRVNDVPGSTAEQRRWHIERIELR